MKSLERHLDALASDAPDRIPADVGVLLLHRGGPRSADEIEPFYSRVWSDPHVTPRTLLERVARRDPVKGLADALPALTRAYAMIGARSPVCDLVTAQARALENVLNGAVLQAARADGRYRVFSAFLDVEPGMDAGVELLRASRVKRAVVLPLYPAFAESLGGACIEAFEAAAEAGRLEIEWDVIASFCADAGVRAMLAAKTTAAFDLLPPDLRADAALLFSVHSPPRGGEAREKRFLAETEELAAHLMRSMGYDEDRTFVGYQGFGGPGGTFEPVIHALGLEQAAAGRKALVVVALSYATDCFETLHDLDIEFYQEVRNHGVKQARRATSPNADPAFIAALARLVRGTEIRGARPQGAARPRPS